MKRLLVTLLVLFALYYGIEAIYTYQSSGFDNTYTITNEGTTYNIKEIYSANTSGEKDNYYITISYGDYTFSYETYIDYKKESKVVTNIYSYNNCIYPVFNKNESNFDITCMVNGTQEYYHDLKGTDNGLDSFATELATKTGYNADKWIDTTEQIAEDKILTYSKDNIVDGHHFALVNYRGLYTISSYNPNKIYSIKLFKHDIYDPTISAFNGKYYVVINYEDLIKYQSFYLVDMEYNTYNTASTEATISSNSFIQGSYEDSTYLLDVDNMKQYEIDINNKSVIEVGNNQTKIKYYNGTEWSRISVADAASTKYFVSTSNYQTTSDNTYTRIDTVGGTKSGYIYYYKYSNRLYKCYRSNKNDSIKTYLFTTSTLRNITYLDDYVYYINDNKVNYYHDTIGVRTLLTDSELKFNSNIKFNVYK